MFDNTFHRVCTPRMVRVVNIQVSESSSEGEEEEGVPALLDREITSKPLVSVARQAIDYDMYCRTLQVVHNIIQ